jgi:hypothetical protein
LMKFTGFPFVPASHLTPLTLSVSTVLNAPLG